MKFWFKNQSDLNITNALYYYYYNYYYYYYDDDVDDDDDDDDVVAQLVKRRTRDPKTRGLNLVRSTRKTFSESQMLC